MTRSVVVITSLVVFAACGPKYLHSEHAADVSAYPVSQIAVMPFVVGTQEQEPDRYRSEQVAQGAEQILTGLLYEALEEDGSFELLSRARVEALVAVQGETTSLPALQQVANELGVDGVLQGIVSVYREREGSHASITRPAAIGVNLWLVRRRDGHVIWRGSYYENQKSMTEELRTVPLYFKRGVRWLTAEELADHALTELVATLSGIAGTAGSPSGRMSDDVSAPTSAVE